MKRVELHVSGFGGEYFAGYLTPEQKNAVLDPNYRACEDIVTEQQEYDVTTVDNIFHHYTANSLDLTIELVSEEEEDNEDEEELILAEEIGTFTLHTFTPSAQDAVNRGFAKTEEEVAQAHTACMAVARKEEGDWFDLEIELEDDEEFDPNRLVFGTFSLQEILNEDEIVAKAYYGDIHTEAFGIFQSQLSEFFATGKYTLTDTLEEIASEPFPPAGVQELYLNTEIAGKSMPLNCEMRVMDVATSEILKEDSFG